MMLVATGDERTPTGGDGRGSYAQATRDLFRTLQSARHVAADDEGLRERKKRLTRQQISDTATMMFLERGFDEVRVAEIAAACDVSEKTVYNYFPTKESLVFDRTDDVAAQLREALRDRGDGVPLVEAALAAVVAEVDQLHAFWVGSDERAAFTVLRRFAELIAGTPALRAAQLEMFERLVAVAAHALAERADVSPDDPEPQVAALAVVGLWRVQFQSMRRYADGTYSAEQMRAAVVADVTRAARMADSGLGSFDAAVQSAAAKQGLREAAEAMNAARRQVVAAVRQARDAWRDVKAELHEHGAMVDEPRSGRQISRRVREQVEREVQRAHLEAQHAPRDATRARQDAAREAQRRRQQAKQHRRGGSSG